MSSVTFLQQTSASQVNPARPADITLSRVFPAEPGFNERMYREIGGDWNWSDRLEWSEGHWASYCSDPCVSTFRAVKDGEVVGFAELRMSPCDETTGYDPETLEGVDVEIVYFGLLSRFAGRGLGGWFLSEVCRIAWNVPGCRRVWLHTCADDSPAAIPNYLSRGFVEYHRADTGCAACTA
ncbi:GNAT family N-acetyltransferase [Dietzia sp. ANT_WB102]|uniref:GNAT family N-acetyltransferase n=1 Tax=Dietzia sp. ANT_WB102 TaxID=2597345 RepID=UPI0011EDB085|nr:GNAT family N-acetyltransferase [Dietzia sp. ANT_WB102]KAA0918291.1 GNAT family N-acetyltransferase [Dietzia sp. ANT_WB102]